MKVFQDLFIRGTPEAFYKTIEEIQKILNKGWTRDFDSESSMENDVGTKYIIFRCDKKEGRPSVALFIVEKNAGEWILANIVPKETSELSFDQYNNILQEFTESLLRPASFHTGVEIVLTKPEESIKDLLSPEAVTSLIKFSSLANRSILHPLDKRRWFDFIIIVHKSGVKLGSSTLQRWLIEEERWPEKQAMDLSSDYENAIFLLEYYDTHR